MRTDGVVGIEHLVEPIDTTGHSLTPTAIREPRRPGTTRNVVVPAGPTRNVVVPAGTTRNIVVPAGSTQGGIHGHHRAVVPSVGRSHSAAG
ncbi:hypothetical protein CH291_22625 [Rhodococcus sp. 14-1411-2a]|nr:hypothetical protein A2J02_03275 [Rhodococcus sp. EPR-147]OZF43308.1 hypothetical protein CH291_22625 [Rhodococcus sp. 14-1411-2a]